jgi:hypothetical protein
MSAQEIITTAQDRVAEDKGLLAMDESNSTGISQPQARSRGRGGRRHRAVSLASRPRCRPGDCLLVGRSIR